MKAILSIIVAISSFIFVGGCGCGDRFAYRRIEIIEAARGTLTPIEVDTSQIEQYSEPIRTESTNSCYCPETQMQINPKYPIKIIIVPATQPVRNR